MADRPLRLLDISIRWPPDYQPFIAGRLRALAAAGVQVTVVTSYHGRFDPSLMPFARIVRLPSARESAIPLVARTALYSALVLKRPRFAARLARVCWSRGRSFRGFARCWSNAVPLVTAPVDIVHFEWNAQAASTDWLPDLLGVPFVVSCRGRQVNIVPNLPGPEGNREELAETFSRAALVHGVCHDILREAETLGMAPEKGRVVYTSVDSDFFHPTVRAGRAEGEPIRLLNVGVSMWRKGYEYLLLALREALDRGIDAQLDIVDFDGPERDRAQYTITDLGLEGKVNIVGTLTPEGVREALWASDIFILSALSEGISNAVIEAMACGLPVITTDCGGMREAVTEGMEGLIVPTRDPVAIAQAIVHLARDPALRAAMGRAGRTRVERDFQPAAQAKQFLAIYEEALTLRSDSGPSRRKLIQGVSDHVVERAVGGNGNGVFHHDRRLEIVTVADLDWRNGHEYALEAIRELIDRGVPVHYTIVGKGPFLEAVGFARRELRLMDDVELILDPRRGDEALQTADLFLLAAVADGSTHALNVALRAGVPAVCTDVASLVVNEGFRCRIVPRRDKIALADAIMQLGERIQPEFAGGRVQA